MPVALVAEDTLSLLEGGLRRRAAWAEAALMARVAAGVGGTVKSVVVGQKCSADAAWGGQ